MQAMCLKQKPQNGACERNSFSYDLLIVSAKLGREKDHLYWSLAFKLLVGGPCGI